MENMTWQVAAAVLGGFIGQFFKAKPSVPTWIPQLVMLFVGTVVYIAFNPPVKDGWPEMLQYGIIALVSGLSVNGAASLVGLHPALKTQEVPK